MLFFFIRNPVADVMSSVTQQQGIVQDTLDTLKSMVPQVISNWEGTDATEFNADFVRKVVPAELELIAAFAGFNLNLTKATNVVDQADQQVKGMAEGLGDVFGQI